MTTQSYNTKSRNTHRECLGGFARVNRISRISRRASDYDVPPLSIRAFPVFPRFVRISVKSCANCLLLSLFVTLTHARPRSPIILVNYMSGYILRSFLRFRIQQICKMYDRRSTSLETHLKHFAFRNAQERQNCADR